MGEYWRTRAGPACYGRATEVRYLHVSVAAARRFSLPPAQFGLFGQVMGLSHADADTWAGLVRAATQAGEPGSALTAGQLLAAVALHELMHALIQVEAGAGATGAARMVRAVTAAEAAVGRAALEGLADTFGSLFVPAAEPGLTALAEVLLEELLLLDLARTNPALAALAPLFDVRPLHAAPAYRPVVVAIRESLGSTRSESSLVDLLEAPQVLEPASLPRQLELALELWGPRLRLRFPAALAQAATALGVLAEEARGGWGPPGPPELEAGALIREGEPEAYSPDAAWMPGVVLVAKSTYVWLAQLSARFGRPIERLDEVPDEALAELAQQGFNALWLIGVWWRSEASRTIKRLRGQPDALASAYSVRDYLVAPELGGEEALATLRERAARHGVRLASDMVPNHTAMDGIWVAEHPDWYVQTSEPPYPGYSFKGPDLSPDPRMLIRLEDHYYDGSDAAVVFQRVDAVDGAERYVYHGNDGTALPWNDTAQLDFLNPAVRAAVIATTVAVARRFPLIRLDAAMTVARRHFRRLWHPQPGEAGAIPSRAARALTRAEFDERMPREFWRELVDALAVEAPGTMLLAEAFWLMEVYFVRSLGMNRVYNSAFMHMTMNEQNEEYRAYLKRFLREAPQVLARFVNYMSNPDEEPAAEQFGDGDKAFGVATLMATLPGLPMFGHGQVEGLREKYGMEYARPLMDEAARPWHVERHRREVAPLLFERPLFAGSELFRLFDVEDDEGAVLEDVYAFVNGVDRKRVLVIFNNSPHAVAGRLRRSAETLLPDGSTVSEALHEALGVHPSPGDTVALTAADGEVTLLPAAELAAHGLWVALAPYESRVFMAVGVEGTGAITSEALPSRRERRRSVPGMAVLTGDRGAAARRRNARRRR